MYLKMTVFFSISVQNPLWIRHIQLFFRHFCHYKCVVQHQDVYYGPLHLRIGIHALNRRRQLCRLLSHGSGHESKEPQFDSVDNAIFCFGNDFLLKFSSSCKFKHCFMHAFVGIHTCKMENENSSSISAQNKTTQA